MAYRLARLLCSSAIKTVEVSSQARTLTRRPISNYCSATLNALPTHTRRSRWLCVRGIQSRGFSKTSAGTPLKPPLVKGTEVGDFEEKRFGGPNALENQQIQQSNALEHRVPQIRSEFLWKKEKYASEHSHQPEITRRVMVIYSGGTLGMKWMKWNDEECEYGACQPGTYIGSNIPAEALGTNYYNHAH